MRIHSKTFSKEREVSNSRYILNPLEIEKFNLINAKLYITIDTGQLLERLDPPRYSQLWAKVRIFVVRCMICCTDMDST